MNIRDIAGISSQQELYELASNFNVHVGSMDKLIRFAGELQKRALADHAKRELAMDRLVEDAEELGLYNEPEKAA
ncbi:hypothetical protein BZM27_05900 [Paraburkholderia steynii]|uniref:Uncharacterized protein n=1 Tax=Paraburkholderia steynii TaxID=1245441 RepID=A0A4R0XFN7_9BURK|nr:hypothetical protein BZM27_05900 [Paraburkholderia steynii]